MRKRDFWDENGVYPFREKSTGGNMKNSTFWSIMDGVCAVTAMAVFVLAAYVLCYAFGG